MAIPETPVIPVTTKPLTAPKVDYRLPAYARAEPSWKLVRDCLTGLSAVSAPDRSYIPYIMPSDKTQANVDRNIAYRQGAVFVSMVRRTLSGLVGQVFSKDPVLDVPAPLEPLRESVDGGPVSMDQQARQALSDVLAVARCGLLVDYPRVQLNEGQRAPTALQLRTQNLRPTIQYYFAEQILNWRIEMVEGLRKVTLVVLEEDYVLEDDGFERKMERQWRVLRLTNKVYTQEIWRRGASGIVQYQAPYAPTGADGKTFDTILFQFIGSSNNDPGVDEAPLLSLAEINIAHYRNSADFEEIVRLMSQPTPWFSGLTQKWIDENWDDGVALGSRVAIPLPQGAQAGLLQVNESQLALKAMEQKERQAVALGAKLVEQKAVQRTATEASMDNDSDLSVLQLCTKNVASAYNQALHWAAAFAGAPLSEGQGYELNTDFEISRLTVDARRQLLAEWTGGGIAYSEYRDVLRRAGIATLDDEEAQAEIDAQTQKDMEFAVEQMGQQTAAVAANTPPAPPPR